MTGDDAPGTSAGDTVLVGRVGPARGVRGELFVLPLTDDPDARFAAGACLLTDPAGRGPLTVESSARAGARIVVRFAGVADRDAAEALRGTELLVVAAARPALDDPDEFYDTDLIGLRAQAPDGAPIGEVRAVRHGGGHDHLVVAIDGREHLVPFVAAIVSRVDVAAGTVVVDAPEGLFEL